MDKQIDIIEQPIEKKKRGPKPKIKTAQDDVIIEKKKKGKRPTPNGSVQNQVLLTGSTSFSPTYQTLNTSYITENTNLYHKSASVMELLGGSFMRTGCG